MSGSEQTTAELVRAGVSDGIGTLTLNRPHRHNAITDEMFEAYAHAQQRVLTDPAVRVVLIRGEGRSFCSGRDTSQLGRRVQGESDIDVIRRHQQPRLAALACPKPIVAAVQGYAFGGGFELALAADLRIAADDAVFALPEIDFALLPDTGGTQLLTALAGPARTKYLVLSGARIDAAQALCWGIVDFVVPRAELEARARELCLRLADRSPTALALGKQLVDQAWAGAIRNGLDQELVAQTALFASAEYRAAKSEREA